MVKIVEVGRLMPFIVLVSILIHFIVSVMFMARVDKKFSQNSTVTAQIVKPSLKLSNFLIEITECPGCR